MRSVSVIIPCYNYGHFLHSCVVSVLRQDGVDVRVLIIDDASTDNTPTVAAELVRMDSRIEYVRHQVNLGHIATYNEGISWASGDYMALLSSDDLLTPGALARTVTVLEAHPEAGLAYGRALTFEQNEHLPAPRTPEKPTYRITPGLSWLESTCRSGHVLIRSPEVVVRTRLQQKLGGYRPELPHAGDIEMWMRFAAHSAIAELEDADQAFYRIHSANMHSQQFSATLADLHQRRLAFDTVLIEQAERIPNAEHLREIVYRILAREALGLAGAAYDRRNISAVPVSDLVNFAVSTSSEALLTLEYMGLCVRMCIGPQLSATLAPLRKRLIPDRLAAALEVLLTSALAARRAGSDRSMLRGEEGYA